MLAIAMLGCSIAPTPTPPRGKPSPTPAVRYSDIEVHTYTGCTEYWILVEALNSTFAKAKTDTERYDLLDAHAEEIETLYGEHLSYTGPYLGFPSAMAVAAHLDGNRNAFANWTQMIFHRCAELADNEHYLEWYNARPN